MKVGPRLRPWTPIFKRDLKYGDQFTPGAVVGATSVASPLVTVPVSIPTPTVTAEDFTGLPNAIHRWDFSNAGSITGSVTTIADLVDSALMTTTGGAITLLPIGTNSLNAGFCNSSGGSPNDRMLTSGLLIASQPFGVSWVGMFREDGIGGCVGLPFSFGSSNQCHYYNDEISSGGMCYANAGTSLNHAWITVGLVLHSWYVEFNGASSKVYRDGAHVVTGNAGTNVPDANGALFNIYGGGLGLKHAVGELSVHDGTQTAGDILSEHQRLQAKWGF